MLGFSAVSMLNKFTYLVFYCLVYFPPLQYELWKGRDIVCFVQYSILYAQNTM